MSKTFWLAPLLVMGSVLGIALLRLLQWLHIGLPLCGLRVLTGLPCPTCGGTRCLTALANFEFRQAFSFNPLVALGCFALWGWFLVWLLDCYLQRDWATRIVLRLQRKSWLAVLGSAALVNWLYLLFYLPK